MLRNFRKSATEAGLVIFGFIFILFFENFIQYILTIFTLLPRFPTHPNLSALLKRCSLSSV